MCYDPRPLHATHSKRSIVVSVNLHSLANAAILLAAFTGLRTLQRNSGFGPYFCLTR